MKNNKRFSPGTITLLSVPVILILMIMPTPALILDILIVINLLCALAILIAVVRAGKAAYIPFLPTLLLVSTVFSLGVNLSAARLILTKGAAFDGRLITAIGSLASGSGEITNLIESCVVFTAIIAVLLMVNVRGAARIVKAAVQFTHDALMGKIMSVDCEYNAKVIDENEAAFKKAAILKESDFYGAIDGAGKLISGNVKVTLIIFALTIAGGIFINTQLIGETINETVKIYIPLAIGSGCFFILHAVLLSVTAGTAVTRAAGEEKECFL